MFVSPNNNISIFLLTATAYILYSYDLLLLARPASVSAGDVTGNALTAAGLLTS